MAWLISHFGDMNHHHDCLVVKSPSFFVDHIIFDSPDILDTHYLCCKVLFTDLYN